MRNRARWCKQAMDDGDSNNGDNLPSYIVNELGHSLYLKE